MTDKELNPSAILSDLTLEAAAKWRLRLSDAGSDKGVQEAFQRWLDASQENRSAIELVDTAWDQIGKCATDSEIVAMRSKALERPSATTHTPHWMGLGSRHFAIAASVAFLTMAVFLSFSSGVFGGDLYKTSIGERRVIALGDGSTLTLDSDTRVSVKYTTDARRLILEKGQARFDVAHDPSRPFKVTVGQQMVLATGTAFNIEYINDKAIVTLLQGKVLVEAAESSNPLKSIGSFSERESAVLLKAGQQLIAIAGNHKFETKPVDIQATQAWESGKLVFQDQALSEVVDRLNRHSNRQILINDPLVMQMKVSGIFHANNAAAFVEAITATLPIISTERKEGIQLHARK